MRGVVSLTITMLLALASPVWSTPAGAHSSVQSNAESPRIVWTFDTGEDRPTIIVEAVHDGVVFAASTDILRGRGFVFAIDAMTGIERWRFQTGWSAFISAVVDGRVYAYGDDLVEKRDILHALDARDGTEIWRTPVDEPIVNGFAVAGTTVLAIVNDHLVAFDAATGEERWTSSLAVGPGLRLGPVSMGAVIVGSSVDIRALDVETGAERWQWTKDQVRICGSSESKLLTAATGAVYALNPATGAELWHFEAEDRFILLECLSTRSGFVYVKDRRFEHVYALDGATGDLMWSRASVLDVSFVEAHQSVIMDTWEGVIAVDATTGNLIWRAMDSSVLATGEEFVYAHDGKTGTGLYGLDARNGQRVWDLNLDNAQFSFARIHNGVFYAANQTGTLYAIA